MRVLLIVCFAVLLAFTIAGCGQTESQRAVSPSDDFVSVELSGVDPEVYEFLALKQQAVRESPNDSDVVGELAMAYEMNGFADSALIGYRHAAKLAPANIKWPYFESLVLTSFGDYKDALTALDRALDLDATYAPGWIWKGRLHLELNELREAADAFRNAFDTDAESAARVGLAQVALREEKAESALNLLQELAQHTVHPQIDQLIRVAQIRLGKPADADSLQPSTIPGQIGFPDPFSTEKRVYEVSISAELTRFRNLLAQPNGQSAAFELIDTLTEKYPENKRVVIASAHRLRLSGDVPELRTLLEQAHATWPNEINFMLGLAELEVASRNSSRALQLLEGALALEPTNAWGLLQRGLALAQDGHFEDALNSLQQALQIDESADIHYYIGHAFAELNDFSRARCHMRRAVELEPEFTAAVEQLNRLNAISRADSNGELDRRSCNRVEEN